ARDQRRVRAVLRLADELPHLGRVGHGRDRLRRHERDRLDLREVRAAQHVDEPCPVLDGHRLLGLEAVARPDLADRHALGQGTEGRGSSSALLWRFDGGMTLAQRPFHSESRLSMNAAMPSRRSSLATALRHPSSSMSMPSSRESPTPTSMARLASRTPTGADRHSSLASASVASCSSSGATTRLTSPISPASAAAIRRPVRISSLALAGPNSRPASCLPPPPAMTP